MRLDQALAARFTLSRRKARELIAAGRVLVNQRPVRVASRVIRKTYLAVVAGEIHDEVTIDSPIDGKEAITKVRPRGGNVVEAEILTGRTHQIRIHLASIGHAVAGDRRYGGPAAGRLMLHAWKLEHD